MKLEGIDNPENPAVECLGSGKGEFWQFDLEKVLDKV